MPKPNPDYPGILDAAKRIAAQERHLAEDCTCPGPTMTDTSCPIHGDDDC